MSLQIGAFAPNVGDSAEDPRYPGFIRIWTGNHWHPRLLLNEPQCICKDPNHGHQYGCLVDDTDLPVYAGK